MRRAHERCPYSKRHARQRRRDARRRRSRIGPEGRVKPCHLASGALALSSAPFESTHNSRTPGDHVTDSRSSIRCTLRPAPDAVAAASASVVAVHAAALALHRRALERRRRRDDRRHGETGRRHRRPRSRMAKDSRAFVGRDRGTDLAVLRIPPGSLRVAELGDPAVLRPGNSCSRWGVSTRVARAPHSVAVSATGGKWRAWKGGEIDRWLQSDLTIYPGFGGGPLVDSTGQIHGINSGALSRPLATTIPSRQSAASGPAPRARLLPVGWDRRAMQPVRTDEGGGLLLVSIDKDTPAATADCFWAMSSWRSTARVSRASTSCWMC